MAADDEKAEALKQLAESTEGIANANSSIADSLRAETGASLADVARSISAHLYTEGAGADPDAGNVADGLFAIAQAINRLADAVEDLKTK